MEGSREGRGKQEYPIIILQHQKDGFVTNSGFLFFIKSYTIWLVKDKLNINHYNKVISIMLFKVTQNFSSKIAKRKKTFNSGILSLVIIEILGKGDD